MAGEAYLQLIIDRLNLVSVRGEENMSRMLEAIRLLENLKKDVIKHKTPETKNNDTQKTV